MPICKVFSRFVGAAAVLLLVTAQAREPRAPEPGVPPLRAAVVPGSGSRTPPPRLLDLVEQQCLALPGATWVERREVEAALGELALRAGLPASERDLALGRILPADVLLLAEGLAGTGERLQTLTAIETRTGGVLSSWTGNEQELRAPVAVSNVLAQAAAKLRTPASGRFAVGLLGFQSEEPGAAWGPLARCLGALLMHDLGARSDCVVLDRQHWQRLADETALAGVEASPTGATVLLEGWLHRSTDDGRILARVMVRTPTGAETARIEVELPTLDVATARGRLLDSVAAALGSNGGAVFRARTEDEAEQFRRRSIVLGSHGLGEDAAAAAEAAHALAPSCATAHAAVRAYSDWACRFGHGALSSEQKQTLLAVQIRGRELEHEWLRYCAVPGDARATARNLNGWCECTGIEPRVELAKGEKALRPMLRAKTTWELRNQELLLELRGPGSEGRMVDLERYFCYAEHWSESPAELASLYRQAFALYLEAPTTPVVRRGQLLALQKTVFRLPFMVRKTECRLAAAETLRWAAEEGGQRGDLPLQLCATVAIAQMSDGDASCAAARLALKLLAERLPITYPDRQARGNAADQWAATAFAAAVERLEPPTERLLFYDRVVSPVVDGGERARIATWMDGGIRGWCSELAKAGRPEEGLAVCERILHALASSPAPVSGAGRNLEDDVQREMWRLRLECGAAREEAGVPMVPVELGDAGPPGSTSSLLALERDGPELVLLWGSEVGSNATQILASRFSLKDGTAARVGELTVPMAKRAVDVVGFAATGDGIHAGLRSGGLLSFPAVGAPTYVCETNGLPGQAVSAVCVAEGRLFVGVSGTGGALYEVLPSDRSFRPLASSLSAQGRSGLDGGAAYRIEALVHDAVRRCVWIGLNRGFDGELWRYAPHAGTAVREAVTIPQHLRGVSVCGRRLLMATAFTVLDYNPDDGTARCVPPDGVDGRWPCLRIGEAMVSIRRGDVRLDALGTAPVPRLRRSNGDGTGDRLYPRHIVPTRDGTGFFLGTALGRVWCVDLLACARGAVP